jgi:diacylglycerol kinase (ATP)
MDMTTRLIVNPAAAGGRTLARAEALRPRLQTIFGPLEWCVNESPAHVTALARDAARQGHPRVIVAGGDGTVHFAANGVVDTPTALAIVPLGTGNDVAIGVGLPAEPVAALDVLAANHVRAIDVGRVADRVYVCVLGVGLDTPAIHVIERLRALPRTRLLYNYAALHSIVTYRPPTIRVTHEGGSVEQPVAFAAVTNTHTYAGGIRICPAARVDDGRLDLCVIAGLPWPKLLLRFGRVKSGRHAGLAGVTLAQSAWVRMESRQPVPVTLDGELTDLTTPIEVRAAPGALRVLGAPAGARA